MLIIPMFIPNFGFSTHWAKLAHLTTPAGGKNLKANIAQGIEYHYRAGGHAHTMRWVRRNRVRG